MGRLRIPHLNYRTKIDLRAKFPLSHRYVLRRTIGWFFLFILSFGCFLFVRANPAVFGSSLQTAYFLAKAASLLIGVILAAKLLHAELNRKTFYYGLEGFRLVISRGICLPQVGSLPLLPVSEIYIHRDFCDALCFVCNIDLYTPMDDTRRFARIESLSPRTAKDLQHFLSELLNVQIFLAPEAKAQFEYLEEVQSPRSTQTPQKERRVQIANDKKQLPLN